MMKRSSLYLIFLFIFSLFFSLLDVSRELFIDFKFLLPQRTFYCLFMFLLVYIENIYIVERIRNLIELKIYIIIRIKRDHYKKMMMKSLFKTLISYLVINVIWSYCFIGFIPIILLLLDMIIKIGMIWIVLKFYNNDHIYAILFVFVIVCKLLLSFIL